MPLAEAMACGKPVITTAYGPSEDFCTPEMSYLIPARVTAVPDSPPTLGALSQELTWFEPDVGELARTMRHVFEHRDEGMLRGLAAGNRIRDEYSWPVVTKMYADRILELTESRSEAFAAR